MAAEAWPSICWTTFTFAPERIANDAAVCRKSCGLRPSSPAAWHAGLNTILRQLLSRRVLPRGEDRFVRLLSPAAFLDGNGKLDRHRHGAGLVGLGRRPGQLAANLCNALDDIQPPTFRVEAAHFERRQLSEPETGKGQAQDREFMWSCRLRQRAYLLGT